MTQKINQTYYDAILRAAEANNREEFRELFLKLHHNDQIEAFHLLYPEKKAEITEFLEAEEFAEIFDDMSQEDRYEALEYLPSDYMTTVFTYAADDNVTALLASLPKEEQQNLLEIMHPQDRKPIEKMLQHDAETAGAVMTTETLTVSVEDTAAQVLEQTRQVGRYKETIYYIYVIDEQGHLEGVLSLRDLILSPADTKMKEIMTTQIVTAKVGMDQEKVAHLIQEYDLISLPVTTIDNILVGIITVDDVIDIIEAEATEDFHKFAGITTREDEAEDIDETVLGMTKARLPWILILLFLGLFSANLIESYESTLEQVVALAAFMPILMDSAGNVGTQSLAVSVRRITMGGEQPGFWTTFWKEFLSGVLIGIASAITIAGIVYVMYGNWALAFIIAFSLLVTLSVSTVVGFIVPAIFDRVGIDPAVASGPFITTLNDIFGLMIYFSLATALIHLL